MNQAAQAARPRLKLPEAKNGAGAVSEQQRAALAQKFRVKNSDKIESMVMAIAGTGKPDAEPATASPAPAIEKPDTKASNEKPGAVAAQRRQFQPFNPRLFVREFQFPDGRPIAIHRAGIRFATPARDDTEGATLVGLKDGATPCPLKVPYAEFMHWWFEGRELSK